MRLDNIIMDRLSFAFITFDSISRLSDVVFSDCKKLNNGYLVGYIYFKASCFFSLSSAPTIKI